MRQSAFALCLVLPLSVLWALPVRAADPNSAATVPSKDETAQQLIDRLSREVLGVLGNKELTTAQKQEKIQAAAFYNIDFAVVSRLTLGKNWNVLNKDQQQLFVQEYRAHLSNTYRRMIDSYTDETLKMVGERDEGRGDRTVLTKVIDPAKGSEFKVDYRVRKEEGRWKIIDISVEGASLVFNFRSQFEEIMNNGGFDKLIRMLREKNAEAVKEGGPATGTTATQPAK